MIRSTPLVFLLFLFAAPLASFEGPSLAMGQALFESPELGTSGKSCLSCHPTGKGLQGVAHLDDKALSRTVNTCIRKPLQGTPLDPASTEMQALILYLRSFAPAP